MVEDVDQLVGILETNAETDQVSLHAEGFRLELVSLVSLLERVSIATDPVQLVVMGKYDVWGTVIKVSFRAFYHDRVL